MCYKYTTIPCVSTLQEVHCIPYSILMHNIMCISQYKRGKEENEQYHTGNSLHEYKMSRLHCQYMVRTPFNVHGGTIFNKTDPHFKNGPTRKQPELIDRQEVAQASFDCSDYSLLFQLRHHDAVFMHGVSCAKEWSTNHKHIHVHTWQPWWLRKIHTSLINNLEK